MRRIHHYVLQVHQEIVADLKGRATKGAHNDDLRRFADKHLRHVIQEAAGLVAGNAAYGAVAIRDVAELCVGLPPLWSVHLIAAANSKYVMRIT